MKVTGFDRAIVYHMGRLYEHASEGRETITDIHKMLLGLPRLNEEGVTMFAVNGLSEALAEKEIVDPGEAQYSSWGFAPFGDEVENAFALAIPGTKAVILKIEKRERVLPAISVRNAVVKRMAKLQAKEIDGWTPTRKDWAEMKDEVQAEMLKFAPIRPTVVNVVIDTPFIYMFTSSAKVAEDCSTLIRSALGSWPVEHALVDEFQLRGYLGRVVMGEVENVDAETFIHIKHDDGEDIKLKDLDVGSESYVMECLTSHYTIRALEMSMSDFPAGIDKVTFRLSDKAIVTGMYIGEADVDARAEATLERYGTDGAAFLTMMANLFQVVHSLRCVLGKLDEDGCVVEFQREITEEDDDEV